MRSRRRKYHWSRYHRTRTLSRGTGAELGTEDTVLNKQLFISYLCEYMRHAADMAEEVESDRYLVMNWNISVGVMHQMHRIWKKQ